MLQYSSPITQQSSSGFVYEKLFYYNLCWKTTWSLSLTKLQSKNLIGKSIFLTLKDLKLFSGEA